MGQGHCFPTKILQLSGTCSHRTIRVTCDIFKHGVKSTKCPHSEFRSLTCTIFAKTLHKAVQFSGGTQILYHHTKLSHIFKHGIKSTKCPHSEFRSLTCTIFAKTLHKAVQFSGGTQILYNHTKLSHTFLNME